MLRPLEPRSRSGQQSMTSSVLLAELWEFQITGFYPYFERRSGRPSSVAESQHLHPNGWRLAVPGKAVGGTNPRKQQWRQGFPLDPVSSSPGPGLSCSKSCWPAAFSPSLCGTPVLACAVRVFMRLCLWGRALSQDSQRGVCTKSQRDFGLLDIGGLTKAAGT